MLHTRELILDWRAVTPEPPPQVTILSPPGPELEGTASNQPEHARLQWRAWGSLVRKTSGPNVSSFQLWKTPRWKGCSAFRSAKLRRLAASKLHFHTQAFANASSQTHTSLYSLGQKNVDLQNLCHVVIDIRSLHQGRKSIGLYRSKHWCPSFPQLELDAHPKKKILAQKCVAFSENRVPLKIHWFIIFPVQNCHLSAEKKAYFAGLRNNQSSRTLSANTLRTAVEHLMKSTLVGGRPWLWRNHQNASECGFWPTVVLLWNPLIWGAIGSGWTEWRPKMAKCWYLWILATYGNNSSYRHKVIHNVILPASFLSPGDAKLHEVRPMDVPAGWHLMILLWKNTSGHWSLACHLSITGTPKR